MILLLLALLRTNQIRDISMVNFAVGFDFFRVQKLVHHGLIGDHNSALNQPQADDRDTRRDRQPQGPQKSLPLTIQKQRSSQISWLTSLTPESPMMLSLNDRTSYSSPSSSTVGCWISCLGA